jgi:hypothetical protein
VSDHGAWLEHFSVNVDHNGMEQQQVEVFGAWYISKDAGASGCLEGIV